MRRPSVSAQPVTSSSRAEEPPTSAAPPIAWTSTVERDHPLAGKIWDVARARFIEEAQLRARVREAAIVLVGDEVENPDHGQIEAALLAEMIDAGRKPAVVLARAEESLQADLERALAAGLHVSEVLGVFNHPEATYTPPAPVVELAVGAELSLAATRLRIYSYVSHPHAGVFQSMKIVDAARRDPLPRPLHERMKRELRAGSCGSYDFSPAGDARLEQAIVHMRALDLRVAQYVDLTGRTARSAFVIAAHGTVSSYRLPRTLQRNHGLHALSIGLVEVRPDSMRPADYASGTDTIPFAYVWFTPRASDDGACGDVVHFSSSGGDAATGLIISSQPSGARVIVDGKDIGHPTPVRVTGLEPGEHEIQLQASGYRQRTVPVHVTSGVVLDFPTVELTPDDDADLGLDPLEGDPGKPTREHHPHGDSPR